jgi:hypothetical protein
VMKVELAHYGDGVPGGGEERRLGWGRGEMQERVVKVELLIMEMR